jgi:hypothetical protein
MSRVMPVACPSLSVSRACLSASIASSLQQASENRPADAVNLVAKSDRFAGSTIKNMGGTKVTRPRAADDFASIRARIEELRREREDAAHTAERVSERDQAIRRARTVPRP